MHADHDNHPMPGPSELHPYPADPVPTLEEKVDRLSNQFAHLMEFVYAGGQNQPQPQPHHDEEVDDFLSHHEEESREEPRAADNEKVRLPKFATPQTFDGTMKDTKSFVSSIILYIKGRAPEFRTTESKIMFALSFMQGGKAQFWRNEAINQIVAGHEPFHSFEDFLEKLEAQFGDPNPKATAVGKLKTMRQGSSSADEFILQFKAEASQTELGEAALIEYLKAGLNPSLFKSIYRLPVMPTTLDQWYEWAFKLDWQYRQEQAESKLLHPHSTHTGSKFGKPPGRSSKKVNYYGQIAKAPPPATAVTLPTQVPQVHQPHQFVSQHPSDAMDVDRAGRRPLIKCFNCGKLGHTAKNCPDKRHIREVGTEVEEKQNFPEQSQ